MNIPRHTDPDLHHIVHMLECNFHSNRPTLDFPKAGVNTHNHLLWMSNLFVGLTRVGPNPILGSYESYLSAAATNHRAMISDTLLCGICSWVGMLRRRPSGLLTNRTQ